MMAYNLHAGYSNFEYVFGGMCFVFLVAVPVLTMRVIAEEKRQRTDQLLYSLPLSMTRVVLGKYLALLTAFALPVAIICLYPLLLRLFGEVYLPAAYSSALGFYLLGAALIAIGLFISSITESQAVAAGLCFVVMLLNYFITSLASYGMVEGVFDLRSVVYFISVAAVFVFLSVQSLEKRRWSE